ncbi:hypothetical protein T440DRAFT_477117 [Plenodomus tracheiphilus IPT5]|uniref:Actin-like ATPase domain-containing protein n=1 Tax=Plenodomus tracheiphilus IPT5 TaxID=1408161 RepID=A0A6A7BG12_9PLEO|nr:hypothetical protein T440DRAFT_477117 [Plenodomus tracheiphilus IPT5]
MRHPIKVNPQPTSAKDDIDFVIGVEFGTTSTGFSISRRPHSPERIFVANLSRRGSYNKRVNKETPILFGHEAAAQTNKADTSDYPRANYVTNHKLLLYENGYMNKPRQKLEKQLQDLKEKGLIESQEDVFCDTLVHMFWHIKSQLEAAQGMTDQSKVGLAFTVPVIWSLQAVATMESCIRKAMSQSGLGSKNGNRPTLFAVNEAGAAALGVVKSGMRDLEVNEDISDMHNVFKETMAAVATLMTDQLDSATRNGKIVDFVVVTGGFGNSPALQQHLRPKLQSWDEKNKGKIKFEFDHAHQGDMVVANGAVMRALDKSNGPKRIPRWSIGYGSYIPSDERDGHPDLGVFDQKSEIGRDGRPYIMNTIIWPIKKGQGELASGHSVSFDHVFVYETDKTPGKKSIASLRLFSSEICTEDYYRQDHEKNRGKFSKLGNSNFDYSHLTKEIEENMPHEFRDDQNFFSTNTTNPDDGA